MKYLSKSNSGSLMMSSKEITQVYNEAIRAERIPEKKHKNVMRDIRNMLKELGSDLSQVKTDTYNIIIEDDGTTREIFLDKDTTLCLVSGWSPKARMALIQRINELEAKNAQPALPKNYLDALKALVVTEEEKQKALAQAEYQDRALTTSQIRNGLKTKENKKLKSQLRGYRENYVSISQYCATEKISTSGISTNSIVINLRKKATNEQKKQLVVGEDRYASWCFDLDFLDTNKEDILVMIELLKQKKSIRDYGF